jgi:probable HAF family extracellular repeat protein
MSEYGAWPVKVTESGDVLINAEGHEFPDATLMRSGKAIRLVQGTHAGARDMNNHQQVIGWVGLKFIGESVAEAHGFLWDDGVFKDLGSIGTEACWWTSDTQCGYSDALDINDQGQIVGSSFDGHVSRAVLWSAKDLVPHDLGFGPSSRAVAINERGQIAGDTWYQAGDAFFRDNGTVVTLGSLGGGKTRVRGMNERGDVVGTSVTASGEVHAFVWRRETGMRDLGSGPFGAPNVGSIAVGINDRGDILGYVVPCAVSYEASCSSWRPMRAVLWRSTN